MTAAGPHVVERVPVDGTMTWLFPGTGFVISHLPGVVAIGWPEPGGREIRMTPAEFRRLAAVGLAHADAAERPAGSAP